MAVKKDNTYIDYDLKYLEKKLKELKKYIDARPFDELQDRMHYKETLKGGFIPTCVATIEAQRKDITQALKDYAEMLTVIKKLREAEAAQIEARGKTEISGLAKKWLQDRE